MSELSCPSHVVELPRTERHAAVLQIPSDPECSGALSTMELWMSGEVKGDVGEEYRLARNALETEINKRLRSLSLECDYVEWAFISIILPIEFLDLKEIVRRSLKQKVMEFRLKIDHREFLEGDFRKRIFLIAAALDRSIDLMAKFKVSVADRERIRQVLYDARDGFCVTPK